MIGPYLSRERPGALVAGLAAPPTINDLGHLAKLRRRAEPRVGFRATSLQAEGSGAYEHIDETIARRVGLDTPAY